MLNGREIRQICGPGKNIHLLLLQILLNSTSCVESSVALLQNDAGTVTLRKRDNNRYKDFISVSGCIEVTINNEQLSSVSGSDATPHHDGPPLRFRSTTSGYAYSVCFDVYSPCFGHLMMKEGNNIHL
jgi:hypothetical protein